MAGVVRNTSSFFHLVHLSLTVGKYDSSSFSLQVGTTWRRLQTLSSRTGGFFPEKEFTMSFGEGLILSSSWWLGRSGESGMLGSSSERASGYRPSLGASRMRPLWVGWCWFLFFCQNCCYIRSCLA
jgi:hypothetical protein